MIMKRLGKYSGRIYEENEVHTMKECGVSQRRKRNSFW